MQCLLRMMSYLETSPSYCTGVGWRVALRLLVACNSTVKPWAKELVVKPLIFSSLAVIIASKSLKASRMGSGSIEGIEGRVSSSSRDKMMSIFFSVEIGRFRAGWLLRT